MMTRDPTCRLHGMTPCECHKIDWMQRYLDRWDRGPIEREPVGSGSISWECPAISDSTIWNDVRGEPIKVGSIQVDTTPEELTRAIDRMREAFVSSSQPTPDPINPPHYMRGKIEAIDIIETITAAGSPASEKGVGYQIGNAQKYLYRAGVKDPDTLLEDLRKALWYVARAILVVERQEKK